MISMVPWEVMIFCKIYMTGRMFLLAGCHVLWHLIKSASGWSHHGKIWHSGWSRWCLWIFTNKRWMLPSLLWVRDKEVIYAMETALCTCAKEGQGCFCSIRTILQLTSPWFQSLLCATVSFNWVVTLPSLIWPRLGWEPVSRWLWCVTCGFFY